MSDFDKVVKGLEQCGMSSECIGRDCPYWHDVLVDAVKACNCTTELVRDALALLKEQDLDIEALKNTIQGMVEGQAIIAGDRRVDVVRCKDCRQNNQCSIQFKFADADNPGNWFCAYGKKRM